eukprot:Skav204094  [mRNA]  locus=scaffold3129:460227:461060:+ [translate_table: standard]
MSLPVGPGDFAEVQIVGPSGSVLEMQLPIRLPGAVEAMRKALRSNGKEAKGLFVFALGTLVIEEDWSLEKLGVCAGASIEVTMLDSLRPCFEWSAHDPTFDNRILDPHTFQRGCRADHTDGVRTSAALPREARCYIRFDKIGTHASVGVATASCKLGASKYQYLYGQDDNSWALCFGQQSEGVLAQHKGQSYAMQDLNGTPADAVPNWQKSLSISFLITEAGKMLATFPGHSEDLVIPFEVPKDLDVFVVASTVYAESKILISSTPFEDRPQASLVD